MQNWEMKHFFPFPLAGLRENKKRKKIQMPRELIAIFSSCIFAHKQHARNSSLEFGPCQHQEKAEKLQEVMLESVSSFSYIVITRDSALELIIMINCNVLNKCTSPVKTG